MKGKTLRLKESDVRHLRRLLGYVRCEIGQEHDEMVSMLRKILPKTGEPSEEGKERVVASLKNAQQVPQYVRAAVKAFERLLQVEDGQVVDMRDGKGLRKL